MGYSGILMNIISGFIIFVYNQTSLPNVENDNTFKATFIFFIITAAFLLLGSSMYFVERNNDFAKYYYEILSE